MAALHQLACWGGYRFAPERLLPAVTIYLHLSQEQLVRGANGVARFEGADPVTHRTAVKILSLADAFPFATDATLHPVECTLARAR